MCCIINEVATYSLMMHVELAIRAINSFLPADFCPPPDLKLSSIGEHLNGGHNSELLLNLNREINAIGTL